MSINKFAFVVAMTAAALAGCAAPASETAPSPAITTNIPVEDPGQSEDHGVPAVTWDAATEEKVKALAADLMGKFARPDLTDRAWFNALQPHMSADYQESAQYIDPGRIPVRQIVSGPVLVREKGNPMSVTAEFGTNNGPWVLSLHRVGQEDPWLITGIAPKDS